MNTLDIILLAGAVIGLIYGFKNGLVKQLTLGAGVVIGLLQATIFYQKAGIWLQEHTAWDAWICYPLSFLVILVLVAALINLAGFLLRFLLRIVFLGIVDRIFGALFSAFVGCAIVVFAVNISCGILPENSITGKTSQNEALLYKEIASLTTAVIEEVKEEVKEEVGLINEER